VVTRDVPPGALAKGVPASIEEGWVAAREDGREDAAGDAAGDDGTGNDGEGAD
jgi:hypothetical protein